MAYSAVVQREHDDVDYYSNHGSDVPAARLAVPPQSRPLRIHHDNLGSGDLFMEQQHEDGSLTSTRRLTNAVHSIFSNGTKSSYDILDTDDYLHDSRKNYPANSPKPRNLIPAGDNILHVRRQREGIEKATIMSQELDFAPKPPQLIAPKPISRSASGRSSAIRNPTPDLHAAPAPFITNVQHLEKTAEKLSMTSSIDDAIRQLHDEQKRTDSRQSSLLSSPIDIASSLSRQYSNPNSIVDLNSAARSGGYSPGGFNMISPRDSSSTSNRARSGSKGSRFGSRPEPEIEGRPLDSFVTTMSNTSPAISRSASIAEEPEQSSTLTQPILQSMSPPSEPEVNGAINQNERPTTSASTNTYEQAQKMFSDFDGEHYSPGPRESVEDLPQLGERTVSSGTHVSTARPPLGERRVSSGNRVSMARPQSYADPGTGQKMVYYPAPVPMMLNLPQKLSKLPSTAARDQRRSQVLSSIPPAARKSTVWLPDVLEDEGDDHLAEDDALQTEEYVPQHQRRVMGGRRSNADFDHMPPQLRASTFFEHSGLDVSQTVEIKGESAVATLDSILDASAYAPVNAFTDHAFAGALGAEVYGTANKRASRSLTQLMDPQVQKRKSFTNLLNRRASSNTLLAVAADENRRSTMSDMNTTGKSGDPSRLTDEGHAEGLIHSELQDENALGLEEEQETQFYQGAPTTLLAELQLRKQQQKQRTKPIRAAYPNGMHSTLLELDAVAQVEKRSRKQKKVNLAWEDPDLVAEYGNDVDDDVPLGLLYQDKTQAHLDRNRPMGLMEKRDMEDNEPLSRRRERLTGRPAPIPRSSTMTNGFEFNPEEEPETLAQRVSRIKAEGGTATGLTVGRPVSGDFTTELMSQFGGDAFNAGQTDIKGKGKETSTTPAPEEEETLGQRRKRLQAEREARAKELGTSDELPTGSADRPALKQRRSMADILSSHPAANSHLSTYNMAKPMGGLLGLHDRQRSGTMLGFNAQVGHRSSQYDLSGGPPAQVHGPTMNFAHGDNYYGNLSGNLGTYRQQQMMMPYANPYGQIGYGDGMMNGYGGMGYQQPANSLATSMMQLQMQMNQMANQVQPLNQGQSDMVERWRQSVMQ